MSNSNAKPHRLLAALLAFAATGAGATGSDGGANPPAGGPVAGLVMPRVFVRPQAAATAAEAQAGADAKSAANAIYQKTSADGSVELSNVSDGDGYSQLAIDAPQGASGAADAQSRVLVPYGVLPVAQDRDAPAPAVASAPADDAQRGSADTAAADNGGGEVRMPTGGYQLAYAGVNATTAAIISTSGAVPTAPPTVSVAGPAPTAVPATPVPGLPPKVVPANPVAPAPTAPQPRLISYSASAGGPMPYVPDPGLGPTLSKIGDALAATGNLAIGRRYLMIDRNTYIALYGTAK
jgi:hypothetical protein